MQILMIAINDPAGTAIEFTRAINRFTEHTCRLITKEIRYNFMFEKDLHLPWIGSDGWNEVEGLLKSSDVFHFHMTADEHIELGPFRPMDYMNGKLIVHHHHGHPDFRGNPAKYRKKYKKLCRKNLLVSTPDLLRLLPGATWQPNIVPIHDPLYMPLEDKSNSKVIISHSPTRRDLKNTDEFVQAFNTMKAKSNLPVELRLIENTSHKECLRLKRESHVLFDHMQGYFGVSSLEGLSQGLCVIAGIDDWNRDHIETFTGERELPWVTMYPHNLADRLEVLLEDTSTLKACGATSRRFMETYWSDVRVVKKLIRSYSEGS